MKITSYCDITSCTACLETRSKPNTNVMNGKLNAFDVEYEIYVNRETEFLLFSLVIRTRERIENNVSVVKLLPYSMSNH